MSVSWLEANSTDGTQRDEPYGACYDGNLLDGACRLLLEQLLDDEAADIARADDCEFIEARHVCE